MTATENFERNLFLILYREGKKTLDTCSLFPTLWSWWWSWGWKESDTTEWLNWTERLHRPPPRAFPDTLYAMVCHGFFSSTILMSMNAVNNLQMFGLEASWRQDHTGVVSSLHGDSRSTEMSCWHCLLPSCFLLLGGNTEAHKPLFSLSSSFPLVETCLKFSCLPFFSLFSPPLLPLLFSCFSVSLPLFHSLNKYLSQYLFSSISLPRVYVSLFSLHVSVCLSLPLSLPSSFSPSLSSHWFLLFLPECFSGFLEPCGIPSQQMENVRKCLWRDRSLSGLGPQAHRYWKQEPRQRMQAARGIYFRSRKPGDSDLLRGRATPNSKLGELL